MKKLLLLLLFPLLASCTFVKTDGPVSLATFKKAANALDPNVELPRYAVLLLRQEYQTENDKKPIREKLDFWIFEKGDNGYQPLPYNGTGQIGASLTSIIPAIIEETNEPTLYVYGPGMTFCARPETGGPMLNFTPYKEKMDSLDLWLTKENINLPGFLTTYEEQKNAEHNYVYYLPEGSIDKDFYMVNKNHPMTKRRWNTDGLATYYDRSYTSLGTHYVFSTRIIYGNSFIVKASSANQNLIYEGNLILE